MLRVFATASPVCRHICIKETELDVNSPSYIYRMHWK